MDQSHSGHMGHLVQQTEATLFIGVQVEWLAYLV